MCTNQRFKSDPRRRFRSLRSIRAKKIRHAPWTDILFIHYRCSHIHTKEQYREKKKRENHRKRKKKSYKKKYILLFYFPSLFDHALLLYNDRFLYTMADYPNKQQEQSHSSSTMATLAFAAATFAAIMSIGTFLLFFVFAHMLTG